MYLVNEGKRVNVGENCVLWSQNPKTESQDRIPRQLVGFYIVSEWDTRLEEAVWWEDWAQQKYRRGIDTRHVTGIGKWECRTDSK